MDGKWSHEKMLDIYTKYFLFLTHCARHSEYWIDDRSVSVLIDLIFYWEKQELWINAQLFVFSNYVKYYNGGDYIVP